MKANTENETEELEEKELSPLERMRGDSDLSPRIKDSKNGQAVIKIIFSLLILAIIFIYIIKVYYHPVIVTGQSMEPTYHNGQILRTDSLITKNTIKRGSVICFKNNNDDIIKRVIGLPGDTISFKDGYVYVNSIKLEDEFDKMNNYPSDEIRLKEDEYYVLGDNRNNSTDSRYIGPVRYDSITAVVSEKAERYQKLYQEVNNTLDAYEEIKMYENNPNLINTESEEK